jgi:hypothetical protein
MAVKSVEKGKGTKIGKNRPATIQELVERYCEESVLRPASEESYRGAARVFVRDTGVISLVAVQREHVLAWRKEVIERCSYVSWNSYRQAMKTLFNLAMSAFNPDYPLARPNPKKRLWRPPRGAAMKAVF